MKIKLIASDMDDTLLNNNREISPRNEAAIKKAIESGIVFTLASGRMYCSMRPYAQKLGLDVPLVSYNGALVKGALSGKVYVNSPLKLQTALDLLQYVKENGHYVQVYMGDKLYVKETYVNEGPVMKRMIMDSRGHVGRNDRRTSHVTVVVSEK